MDPDFDLDAYLDSRRRPDRVLSREDNFVPTPQPGGGGFLKKVAGPFRFADRAMRTLVQQPRTVLAGATSKAADVMSQMRETGGQLRGAISLPEAPSVVGDVLENRLRGMAAQEFQMVDDTYARLAETNESGWDTAADITGGLAGMGLTYMGAGVGGRALTGMRTLARPGLTGAAADIGADVAFAAPLDIATTVRPEDSSAHFVEMFTRPENFPEIMQDPEGWKERLMASGLETVHAVAERANATPAGRAAFETIMGGAADAVLRGTVAGVRGQARYMRGLDEVGGAGLRGADDAAARAGAHPPEALSPRQTTPEPELAPEAAALVERANAATTPEEFRAVLDSDPDIVEARTRPHPGDPRETYQVHRTPESEWTPERQELHSQATETLRANNGVADDVPRGQDPTLLAEGGRAPEATRLGRRRGGQGDSDAEANQSRARGQAGSGTPEGRRSDPLNPPALDESTPPRTLQGLSPAAARTSAGAAVGAAVDDENRLRGAAVGAVVGAGAPAAARRLRGMDRAGAVPIRGKMYSRLERAITNAPQARATAAQWRGMLDKAQGGVSKGEREFTGINELLSADPNRIFTRDELFKHLEESGIRLEETTIGGMEGEYAGKTTDGAAPAGAVGALARTGGGALAGGAVDASVGTDSPIEGFLAGAALANSPSIARRLQGARRTAVSSNEALERALTEVISAERTRVTPSPDIDPDEFVNIGKFALDPTGEARLGEQVAEAVERYGLHPKEVVTWEQTKDVARSLGLQPQDLANKLGGRRKASGAEMLAARNVISTNVEATDNILRQLDQGGLASEEVKRLDTILGSLEAQNQHLLGKYLPASSEAGRVLNSMKIAANRSMDPATWVIRTQRALGDALPAALMGRISQLAKAEDVQALTKLVADLQQSTLSEKGVTLWKAGLLTALPTHEVNLISTSAMVTMEAAKDVPAALVDRALSVWAGTARTKDLGGVTDQFVTAWRGAHRGWREAKAAMKGMPTQSSLGKWDQFRQVNYDNKFLDGYTKFVFRSLGAMDRLLAGFTTERSLAEQARLVAKAEGLKGAELSARIEHLTLNPTDDMALNAIAASEISTFTNQGMLGSFASSGKRGARQLAGKLGDPAAHAATMAGDFMVPFTMTPANVATRVAEYSPLGAVSTVPDLWKLIRGGIESSDMSKVQKRIAERIGRSAVGMAPIALGMMLYRHKVISLGYPTSAGERGRWQVTGQQENSVKIGDKWMSLERVSPLGNLVVLGGYVAKEWDNPESTASSKIVNPTVSIARTVSEQSFLEGMRQMLETLQGTERPGGTDNLGARFAGSFVPNVLRRINRWADPTVRVRKSAGDQLVQGLPGMSDALPARIDPLGEEMSYEGGFAGAMLDPFYSRQDKTVGDPIRAMIAELEVNIGGRRKLDDETPIEYERRQRIEGAALRRSISALMSSPEWQGIEMQARVQFASQGPEVQQRATEIVRRAMVEELIRTERGRFSRDYGEYRRSRPSRSLLGRQGAEAAQGP